MAKLENPSAFKHSINIDMASRIAKAIVRVAPSFPKKKFLNSLKNITTLELKGRVHLLRDALKSTLPDEYPSALKILVSSLEDPEIKSWHLWPYTDFVQTYGLDHWEISLNALYLFTKKFTSEFAVRPFLIQFPEKTLAKLNYWAGDPDMHVRRWVSEGTRPYLPWGERLKCFVEEPAPTLVLLEKLKYDPELYVRKSIANHLNDISKDHPDRVVKILERWKKESPKEHLPKILWIQNHALRTLIKKGNINALRLMGVSAKTEIKVSPIKVNKTRFKMSETVDFNFRIESKSKKMQKLVVDYIIHHVKSNNERSPKVFKLKTLNLGAQDQVLIRKKHSLKPITTRKYYSGKHLLEIQINGKIYAKTEWHLQLN